MLVAWLALTLTAAPLKAGPWTITQTDERGTATDGKETLTLWDRNSFTGGCDTAMFKARVVSVVWTYVSLEVEAGGDCGGAHPMAWHGYQTVDLGNHGKPLKLDDLILPLDIDAAVRADPWVKNQLAEQNKKTVEELDTCAIDIPGIHDAHFAFVEAAKGTVGIRAAPGHGYEVCRGAFTVLGLTVKAPPILVDQVKTAAAAKTLLRDLVH